MEIKKLINSLIGSLFFISLSIQADNIEISPGLYNFNYEEFGIAGNSLDKEIGLLPGIKVKFSKRSNSILISPFAAFYGGTIDYIGHTQMGQPHNTETNEKLLILGLDLLVKRKSQIGADLTLGVRSWQWDRDILSRNNVRGLHENYRWLEFNAGLSFESEIKDQSFYTGTMSILLVVNPEMKIFLENSSEVLSLGENPGFRLSTGKTWISDKHKISFNVFAEYWQFGRSNSVFTNDFFGSSVFITEPESETFHTGIEFSINSKF